MSTFDKEMTATEFNGGLRTLGLSVYASAKVLGISLRQAQRYSSGEEAVAWRTARHVRILLFHVADLKKNRKQLIGQIKALESGRGRIYNGRTDVTAAALGDARRRLSENERLLNNHPAGIRPGLD
jgi:hypothetical protein